MSTPSVTNANIITFIISDPRSVGFSAIRSANPGSDQPLINAANNASGPGAGTVAGNPITGAQLFSLINASEWAAMTAIQNQELTEITDLQSVDMGDAGTQAKLNLLLATFANSLAAVQAIYTVAAGPWETYFGKGNLANASLLDSARNSGSGNNF